MQKKKKREQLNYGGIIYTKMRYESPTGGNNQVLYKLIIVLYYLVMKWIDSKIGCWMQFNAFHAAGESRRQVKNVAVHHKVVVKSALGHFLFLTNSKRTQSKN